MRRLTDWSPLILVSLTQRTVFDLFLFVSRNTNLQGCVLSVGGSTAQMLSNKSQVSGLKADLKHLKNPVSENRGSGEFKLFANDPSCRPILNFKWQMTADINKTQVCIQLVPFPDAIGATFLQRSGTRLHILLLRILMFTI